MYFMGMAEPNQALTATLRFLYGVQVCTTPEQFESVEEIEDYLAS